MCLRCFVDLFFNIWFYYYMNREVYFLYGSQTGNSEFIAKDIFKTCSDAGWNGQCLPLNNVKKIDLKPMAKAMIIVCSTTGNGDCPENADMWWRSIKLRSVVGPLTIFFLLIDNLTIRILFISFLSSLVIHALKNAGERFIPRHSLCRFSPRRYQLR